MRGKGGVKGPLGGTTVAEGKSEIGSSSWQTVLIHLEKFREGKKEQKARRRELFPKKNKCQSTITPKDLLGLRGVWVASPLLRLRPIRHMGLLSPLCMGG